MHIGFSRGIRGALAPVTGAPGQCDGAVRKPEPRSAPLSSSPAAPHPCRCANAPAETLHACPRFLSPTLVLARVRSLLRTTTELRQQSSEVCLPSVLQQLTERACRRRRACLLGLPPPLECSELAGGDMRTRAKCPRSPAAGPAVQHQTWFNELPDEILLQASLFPGTGWQQGCCPLPGTMYRPQVLAGQLHAGARQGGARCKCGDRALLALSTKHLPALRCFGKHVLALARP